MMAPNNWVVAGSRSASGKPILCNDPHLEVNRLPNVWYEAALCVTGSGVPPRSGAGASVQLTAMIGTKSVSSVGVAAGQWHHVVLSLSRPTLRLWVDGVRSEVGGVSDTFSLAALRLGGLTPAGYSGVLDEVWVSQTAATTDDQALQRFCPL